MHCENIPTIDLTHIFIYLTYLPFLVVDGDGENTKKF